MSWKKHFRIVNTSKTPAAASPGRGGGTGTSSNFASYLPEVYAGHPNRIQRYYQYDDMDRDSDICAALDTIADFCTQSEEQSDEPFRFHFNSDPTESQVKLLQRALTKWVKDNDFRSRLWYMFRATLKNGDAFFLRDPETYEWLWIDHYMVEMVKVDDSSGKEPDEYIVRGLDYNKQAKFATRSADPSQYRTAFGSANVAGARPMQTPSNGPAVFSLAGAGNDPRGRHMMGSLADQLFVVDADNVVHLSLNVGMDINWPFGQSLLEPVFKVFKQKELLEDSIIIYRVSRAPERRIFKIDTGDMNPTRARAHIEQIKNEIHQRRIPNRTGGGTNILDAAYNPLCLAMDTQVPLLDGRTLTITELAEEFRQGRENWVYSCDPTTGEIVPGNITWAGVTRQNAQVVRLTLDNGETITCTPDHKFPVLGRGKVEAKDLTPDDSLIAFNTRERNVDRKAKNANAYTQVFDHKSKKWVFVHRMVGEFFRTIGKHQEFTFLPEHVNAVKQVIHHKDYNRYNNDPRNLAYMNRDDHIAYHVAQKGDWWANLPTEEAEKLRARISEGLRSYHADRTQAERQEASERAMVRGKAVHAVKRETDPAGYKAWVGGAAQRLNSVFVRGSEAAKMRGRARMAAGGKAPENQALTVSPAMMRMLVDLVRQNKPTRIEAAEMLSQDPAFLAEVRRANPPIPGAGNKIDYDKVSPMRIDLMVEKSGYAGWRDFTRKTALYNHRVTTVEYLTGETDVGTVTVDGPERWHGHHTFATTCGIFAYNSVMEDYFFAQGVEGRGSSVETLPGGEQTGEIGDLLFFSRKLARGLRIPTSYLALGNDEGSNNVSYQDGKLGAALIQEYRFNKYCIRLQSLLAPTFDKEFKRFLDACGFEIEEDLFELRFVVPQNFSRYREIEVDSAQMNVYSQIAGNTKFSERFKQKRWLGLTDDEIIENETLWEEENAAKMKGVTGQTPADDVTDQGLGAIGMQSGGLDFAPMPEEPGAEGGELPPEGGVPPGPGPGPTAPPPPAGGGGAAPAPPA